ncbi:phosphoesterase PA-phosphatase [Longispora sp. NPDC051575]|uniref:phosphoesterase PA-phosphatase n=1 Tax=Longispora sp. NPDC051575 TaxID=3154943 RepID=UPI0034225B76
MTTPTAAVPERRWARAVTDHLEPKNWIIALTLGVGVTTAGWTGLAWGAFSALVAAVIPTLIIKKGIRAGRWSDRHLGARTHRLVVMIMILASVAAGITVMVTADAPRPIVAVTLAMFATLALLASITTRWKISVHAAVSAGATAMAGHALGWPVAIPLAVIVGVVAWSRVALRDHTRAQVIAGAFLGAVIAGTVYALAA